MAMAKPMANVAEASPLTKEQFRATAGALQHRREAIGAAELDDLARPRPRPIVLQQRIGDQPGPGDEHERKKDPLRQAEPEETAPLGKNEDDADHRQGCRGPGHEPEAETQHGGERRVIE
jgi:hypothetical protein